MADNILHFPGALPPLEGTAWDELEHIVIMARKRDGKPYFACTDSDDGILNLLADKFKQMLLEDG